MKKIISAALSLLAFLGFLAVIHKPTPRPDQIDDSLFFLLLAIVGLSICLLVAMKFIEGKTQTKISS